MVLQALANWGLLGCITGLWWTQSLMLACAGMLDLWQSILVAPNGGAALAGPACLSWIQAQTSSSMSKSTIEMIRHIATSAWIRQQMCHASMSWYLTLRRFMSTCCHCWIFEHPFTVCIAGKQYVVKHFAGRWCTANIKNNSVEYCMIGREQCKCRWVEIVCL